LRDIRPVLLICFVLMMTIHIPQITGYIVRKPKPLRAYAARSFSFRLELLLIYNGSEAGKTMIFGQPIYVNNFWSQVSLDDLKVIEGGMKEFYLDTYDLNVLRDGFYEHVPRGSTYGFTHYVLLMSLAVSRPREEFIIEMKLKVQVSKVDGSLLSSNVPNGTILDARKELHEDYDKYTAPTFYWDYDNPLVQEVISSIRTRIENKYARPIDHIPIWSLVRELMNWLSYNTYYSDRFDYPYFRLKVSKLLNRTIEVDGRRKYYGVCRHIVDIFVALARGLGIPANRYEGMVFNDFSGKVTFLGFHAWAEVYLPHVGWVPLEVTITHPFDRDVVDIGDLEYMYYVPLVHEYNNCKPPFLSPFLVLVTSASVINATLKEGGNERGVKEGDLSMVIHVPTLGSLSIKDFLLMALLSVLIIDDLYLHRRLSRERSSG